VIKLSLKQEKRLISQLVKGEKEAIEEFYSFFKPRLSAFVASRIDSHEDIEEIVQDTLLAALDSIGNFSARARLFSWLCAIARHETADFYRKRKIKTILFSRFPFLETLAHQALGPEGKALKSELKSEVKLTLKGLRREYAQLLRLKYLEGFSLKEIASLLKTTPKAVESKLTRARKAFSCQWQKLYPQPNPLLARD